MQKLIPFVAFLIVLGVVTYLVLAERARPEPTPTPDALGLPEALNDPGPAVAADEPTPHPVSLLALAAQSFDGRELRLVRVLAEEPAYTRHFITYQSGTHTISGIMNIPKGSAPERGWPLLVLNHGHIDTAIYTNGRGLRREQDYFARNGFAVLHPDYRDHAQSTPSREDRLRTRLGYAEDVINAVYAAQRSDLPINPEAVGMLGHSMGGGIAQTVAIVQPGLIKAAVLYAPVSFDYQDSYRRWMARDAETVREVTETYGTPESNPDFWAGLNGERYLDRITIPLRYYHGTADADVPLQWSEESVRLLGEAERQVELVSYPGEGHEFGPRWNEFMRTSVEFFRQHGVR